VQKFRKFLSCFANDDAKARSRAVELLKLSGVKTDHKLTTVQAVISRWLQALLQSLQRRLHAYNGVFTRSSKRPANFQLMYSKYTC